jgi:oligopeptide transport system ATP-binding protein
VTELLDVSGLEVEFRSRAGPVRAVRGISYSLARGEVLGLVGESGSGKSVSALALVGLLPPAGQVVGGTAEFAGVDLLHAGERRLNTIRGASVAMVFQDPSSSLNPVLTVGRQLRESLAVHLSLGRAAAKRRAAELLDLVGIPDPRARLDDYPHQFSGGMRQRVMIAIAVSCQPGLLIADEPTSALDVTIQAQILALLDRLRRELDMAVLLITHDMGVVAGIADRVAVMYNGRLVEMGDTEEVLSRPRHPYTFGLLQSVPRIDQPRRPVLLQIDGTLPEPHHEFTGCSFEPRCGNRQDDCVAIDPELAAVDGAPTHVAACHHQIEHRLDVASR